MTTTIDSTGLSVSSYSEIIDDYVALWKLAIGENARTDAQSVFGSFIRLFGFLLLAEALFELGRERVSVVAWCLRENQVQRKGFLLPRPFRRTETPPEEQFRGRHRFS